MASYESPSDIIAAINDSTLTDTTKDAINNLLAQLGGNATAAAVSENLTEANLAALVGGAAVVMMGTGTTANVAFAADSPVKAIVVGDGGGSSVAFTTSDDVVVALQGGMNDTVNTAAGNDTISVQGGSATVNTGGGDDTVAIANGEVNLTSGDGNLSVIIETGATGSATIDAGQGFDEVRVGGNLAQHVFDFVRGMFTMRSPYELDMKDVNIVTFSANANDENAATATVLATTAQDSLLAKLYQVALDRDNGGLDNPADGQLGGLEFWINQFSEDNLEHAVYSFLNCEEFHTKYDGMDNQAYVEALFNNMGLATDAVVGGKTLADFVSSINGNLNQDIGRYDVAWALAASEQTVQLFGSGAGDHQYVIDADGLDFQNPLA